MQLCPLESQDPAPPTSGQVPAPPSRKPALASRPASFTREQTLDTTKLQSHSVQTQPAHSRQDLTLEPVGPWPCPTACQHKLQDILDPIHNCVRNWPPSTSYLTQTLGSLGPAARLHELALSASSPALTPGPDLIVSWWATAPETSGP